MKLRQYQEEALDIIEAMIVFGSDNITLEATTSWGKSAFMAGICQRYPNDKIVIMVNREPLIEQISYTLNQLGIDHSILKNKKEKFFDKEKNVQLIMSQTFYKRQKSLYENIDKLIIDERHIEYDTMRTNVVLDTLKPKTIIAVTATPFDAQGYALNGTEIVRTATVEDLTNDGYLSPIKYYVPLWAEKVDYSNVETKYAEYILSSLDMVIGSKNFIDNAIKSMNEMDAKNKKTLVFCSTIEMCNKINDALVKDGYSSATYHSKNNNKDNENIMESFKNNTPFNGYQKDKKDSNLFNVKNKQTQNDPIKCLVSVSKLTTGFSVNDIDLGVVIRPTKILSLWHQIAGRLRRKSDSLDETLKEIEEFVEYE